MDIVVKKDMEDMIKYYTPGQRKIEKIPYEIIIKGLERRLKYK